MDRDLSLADFRVVCHGMRERGGGAVYDVRVGCLRDGNWELAGVLRLRGEEWLRLLAVFQAHEANREKLPAD